MMDAADSADMLEDEKLRTQSVDLNTDTSLMVDISDALSERDRVKFTVHTKTTLPTFKEGEFSVVREHEEFVWLHDRYVENEDYAGIIIPPAPPKPDFDVSREKLQKLGEGDNATLATEKTKKLHIFCDIHTLILQIFLHFKDIDEFYETEKKFLVDYNSKLKDSTRHADRMTKSHKSSADTFIRISSSISQMGTSEYMDIARFFNKVSDYFEKARKLEGRVASDQDLKTSDLPDFNPAPFFSQAETAQQNASEKFDHISEVAKQELTDFKTRRVQQFRKNLTERAELELKHAKAHVNLLKTTLAQLKEL
ncbi:PREDICTED: sorting nexin-6-like [Acropora digitifera]|uniref:sorting nexin-6-like n=1 Tax=Acropora digitifera TaxID=70779 RepID=UPI00077AE9EB|nr:PREDICTED: sorting nexin-6-like [Acropora digitifera]